MQQTDDRNQAVQNHMFKETAEGGCLTQGCHCLTMNPIHPAVASHQQHIHSSECGLPSRVSSDGNCNCASSSRRSHGSIDRKRDARQGPGQSGRDALRKAFER